MITREDAIYALVGGEISGVTGGECFYHSGQTPPTQAEIDAKLVEMQEEYNAQEYARNRALEYPSIEQLVVALYDTNDKSAVEAKRAAVKAKYPKPE
jgi:hypothetical protein